MRIAIAPLDETAFVIFSPETRVTWNASGELVAERDTASVFCTDGSGVLLSGLRLKIRTLGEAVDEATQRDVWRIGREVPAGYPRYTPMPRNAYGDFINSRGEIMPGVRTEREAELCLAYARAASLRPEKHDAPPALGSPHADLLRAIAKRLDAEYHLKQR